MSTNPEAKITKEEVNELANPFILVKRSVGDIYSLRSNIQDNSLTETVRVIRGDKSRSNKEFADEVSAALQLPISFNGLAWDGFNESINDLDWLPSTESYLLIFTNADQLLKDEDYKQLEILLNILKDASSNWETGINREILVRAYQEEIVPKSTKFKIVFQVDSGADITTNFGKWLNSTDIPNISAPTGR